MHLTSMDYFPTQVHKKPILDDIKKDSHCVPGVVGVTSLKHCIIK
jgi:hypothetical protein